MRSCNFVRTFIAVSFCAFVVGSASAAFDANFFQFTGWNDALVSSGAGQTFNNIIGTTSVNVKLTKAAGAVASSVSVDSRTINTGHLTNDNNNPNTLLFTFSDPLQLVVQFKTVDTQERVTIAGDGPESYSHIFGALPTIVPQGNGVAITGNGTGISPTGASKGDILTGPTTTLTITHAALGNFANKYEFFMVGQLVPEPSSLGALGALLFGVLSMRRRS